MEILTFENNKVECDFSKIVSDCLKCVQQRQFLQHMVLCCVGQKKFLNGGSDIPCSHSFKLSCLWPGMHKFRKQSFNRKKSKTNKPNALYKTFNIIFRKPLVMIILVTQQQYFSVHILGLQAWSVPVISVVRGML